MGGGASGRVTSEGGGIVGKGRAEGAGGGVLTLGDRARREALIRESLLSSPEEVGMVATVDCKGASEVLTVSSGLVVDARGLSDEQTNGIRRDWRWIRHCVACQQGWGSVGGEA